ncbi:ABC transporter permease [Lacticaseibacillus zeae]|uniref:ABC transporter permease n=1 Tax=Lacticaseibacillus zeae subsp. silagei TaxID=3068307 RepID=A0ABD7Z6U8_LACZE|nr:MULTISPECIES: ABC transporter permease [Lacticaseibacillus]MDE3315618.1 ABC transporter permease [Lacticaseibacillus zeae]OFS00552.1 peptide ABC transporter permease [Lactobacillus sp. HMSC068F07]WLV82678.1 ABC transporter permease [Lacticaseibacillus sp. NCIMB 15475]WLV87492.1 ABC transporter permease [Lacticaseibacillus sp. NCIMB 15474]
MIKLIVRRFIELLISTFLIATATFFLISAVPGDALSAQTDKLPATTRAQVYKNTGLNKPVMERYVITMNNMLHGQFGESIADPSVTMSSLIRDRLPASARLGIQQMLLGIPLGLLLGILAAVYKNIWIDRVVTILALFLMSFPSLVLGLLLQSYFGGKLGWFPIIGWPSGDQLWWGGWIYTILPTIAGGIGYIAGYARLLKNSMVDVASSEYVMTARAKGLSEPQIVLHHIVRNAFIPIITSLPVTLAFGITGSIFIESIFVIPGIGQYFVTALTNRDVPIIMGETVLLAILYIVTMFITDLLYTVVDPRIKLYDN